MLRPCYYANSYAGIIRSPQTTEGVASRGDNRPTDRVLPIDALTQSVIRSKGHRKLLRFQLEILLK